MIKLVRGYGLYLLVAACATALISKGYGPQMFAAVFSIGPVVGLLAAARFHAKNPEPDHAKPRGFKTSIAS